MFEVIRGILLPDNSAAEHVPHPQVEELKLESGVLDVTAFEDNEETERGETGYVEQRVLHGLHNGGKVGHEIQHHNEDLLQRE